MKFKKYLKPFLVIATAGFVSLLIFAEISKAIMTAPVTVLTFVNSISSLLFTAGSYLLITGIIYTIVKREKDKEKTNTIAYIMIISAFCCFFLAFAINVLIS